MEFLILILGIVFICFVVTNQNQKNEEEKWNVYMEKFEIDTKGHLGKIDVNGLPNVSGLNVKLKPNEVMHHVIRGVEWLEMRVTRTGNIGGFGITSRMKIADGVYLRGGFGKIAHETKQDWKVIEAGDFFITNQRWFLVGEYSTKRIMLSKILSLSAILGDYNGLVVKRETGKDVLINMTSFQAEDYAIALKTAG